ncbi:hypothetical protein K438DRAFT_1972369 [Mycena galopus ATCC 62051]|nr:hypothetical protein K438DRAFT_1972369 [Mycena galopus ATCC 62051]
MDAAASSSSSSRASPFSLVEFGNLVSAALDSPDPLFSSLSLSYGRQSVLVTEESANSRVRQIIQKFKKRASGLVRRSSTRTAPVTRATSPDYRIPELRLSHHVPCDEFVPYLPLVAQYERATRQISTRRSTPSLPSQCSPKPKPLHLYAASHSSFATPLPSPTPSASSCSSASTSSTSHGPATPRNTVFEDTCRLRRWSSETQTDENPTDPFAKPAVPACVPLPRLSRSSSASARTRSLHRRARIPPSPPRQPPPARPVPALPPLPKYLYNTHPYGRAVPQFPASPPPSRSHSHSHSHSRSRSRVRSSTSLLDAFPAPPTHTPPPTPPRSAPFPFACTPTTTTPTRADWDWLELEASPSSASVSSSLSALPDSHSPFARFNPNRERPDSSCSDADTDMFHSACSGSSCL